MKKKFGLIFSVFLIRLETLYAQPQVIKAMKDITDLYFIGSQRPGQTEMQGGMG